MMNKVSRRHLLKALLAMAGAAGLRQLASGFPPVTQAQTLDQYTYLPIILKNGSATPTPPSGARVVHVYNSGATTYWNGSGYYGDHVNQAIVTTMVESGVKTLTGTSTLAGAWQALLSRIYPYSSGKRIAIKVNFNNSPNCTYSGTASDALYHPVNAIISGLQAAGVQLNDIYLFDTSRGLPSRFINGITTKTQIHFLDAGSINCGGVPVQTATWNSSDSSAIVHFTHPNLNDQKVPDVLVDATYVINMPILRGHPFTGVTFGFKNHLGCLEQIDPLHGYIDETGVQANPNSNPLVDLYKNSNIRFKTILTVGDGLFGGNQYLNTAPPAEWPNTFKSILGTDAPNSLFFATDPVAIDCVMSDIIKAEIGGMANWAIRYLQLAAAAGLGTFEQGAPWATPIGSGYSQIDYMRI